MNAKYLTRYACALRTTLGSRPIIAWGREAGHCRRLRRVTPPRLVYALLEALGGLRVRTIADLLRTFNAQNDLAVRYKAFYNRLAHRAFPQFMRQVYSEVLRKLSVNMLRAAAGSRLEFFRDVVVQDGSSFAVHDGLATVYGGRFTKIRPAAVELHTFISVFQDRVLRTELAADKEPERAFLPAPESLRGKLLLIDRGYQDLAYWEKLTTAGGFFIARGKCDLDPTVRKAWVKGRRTARLEGYRLQDLLRWLPRRRLDLMVQWPRPEGRSLRLRMVLIWNPANKQFTTLVTNVTRRILTARQVADVYRLRWQIELIFKEWKSFANLHEFTSANPALVEGLIWASLAAAALKRSLAHACQRTHEGVAVSTQIAAMCGMHILRDILRCARNHFRNLLRVLDRVFRYLCNNATRAHPERDRVKGRLRAGLAYVGARA